MSSPNPPTKRKRGNEENKSAEVETLTMKSKYWFEDGNVVLQAQNTQFRVHRSMLAHHSNVFKVMFSMPQPPVSKLDVYTEGCPVIILGDKAKDVEYMISMFYDNFRNYNIRKAMAFDHLAAILRLGKKYEIGHFCTEGLRRMRAEFPSTFEGWNLVRSGGVDEILDCDNYLENVVNLAHELSIQSVLPSAYLMYVMSRSCATIFSAFYQNDTEEENTRILYPTAVEACLKGRESLLHKTHLLSTHWSNCKDTIPCERCITPKHCRSHVTTAISAFLPSDSFMSIAMVDTPDITVENTGQICENCRSTLGEIFEAFRASFWQRIPPLFGLDTWEMLKDFDA